MIVRLTPCPVADFIESKASSVLSFMDSIKSVALPVKDSSFCIVVGRITVIVALGNSGEATVSSRWSFGLVFMAPSGFSEVKFQFDLNYQIWKAVCYLVLLI